MTRDKEYRHKILKNNDKGIKKILNSKRLDNEDTRISLKIHLDSKSILKSLSKDLSKFSPQKDSKAPKKHTIEDIKKIYFKPMRIVKLTVDNTIDYLLQPSVLE